MSRCSWLSCFFQTGLLLLVGVARAAMARDLFVDPVAGDDRSSGLDREVTGKDGLVKTIARGVRLAGAGDVVHLAKAVYRESIVLHDKVGEPGLPIIVDGHGSTLEGSDPLRIDEWREVSLGLWRCAALFDKVLRLDMAVIDRWFFVFDGRMQLMNRSSKGPSQPLKQPDQLVPGEWTFVKDEVRSPVFDKTKYGEQIYGDFFVRLAPGMPFADARISAPIRSSGVTLGGDSSHVVVKNVTSTHVYNDGFNIHGKTRECLFENIAAIECGDDGFSAHDDCQCRFDGFTSIGNSTGLCDTGDSVTDYSRVFIKDCVGHDLYFLDTNRHSIRDSVVLSSAWRALAIIGREAVDPTTVPRACSVELDNVLIRREQGSSELRVTKNSSLTARRVTLLGLHLQPTRGTVSLHHSVLAGTPASQITIWNDVTWQADHNYYDIEFLRLGRTFYSAKTFAEFRLASGQDEASRYEPVPIHAGLPTVPGCVGAEPGMVAELIHTQRKDLGR